MTTMAAYEFQAWARAISYVRIAGAYTLNCQGDAITSDYETLPEQSATTFTHPINHCHSHDQTLYYHKPFVIYF